MSAPIYVDQPFHFPARGAQAFRVGSRHNHKWCHMWSENVEALHRMAKAIGMRREWFQNKPGFPHYDLVPSRRAHALRLGAVERDLMDYLREKRKANNGDRTNIPPGNPVLPVHSSSTPPLPGLLESV